MAGEGNEKEKLEEDENPKEDAQKEPTSKAKDNKKKEEELDDPRDNIRKKEKKLRARYEGKEMALVDFNRIMWSSEQTMGDDNKLFLTHSADHEKKPKSMSKVPKDLSLASLDAIDRAVRAGVLNFKDDLTKYQKERLGDIDITDLNEDGVVEEMEQIDYLLHLSTDAVSKELDKLEREKIGKKFFESLLKEEQTGKKRDKYIELIERYL